MKHVVKTCVVPCWSLARALHSPVLSRCRKTVRPWWAKSRVVVPTPDNTLLDIARHFDVGYEEIANANPGMSVWTPGKDARVVVPTRYILPPNRGRGIVVNLPQRRLYYFRRCAKASGRKW